MKTYTVLYKEKYYRDACSGVLGPFSTLEKAQKAALEWAQENEEADGSEQERQPDEPLLSEWIPYGDHKWWSVYGDGELGSWELEIHESEFEID